MVVEKMAAALEGAQKARSGQREIGGMRSVEMEDFAARRGRSFTLGEGDRTTVAEKPVGGCGDQRCYNPEESDTILLEFLGWMRESPAHRLS